MIYRAEETIEQVYFPHTGVVSLVVGLTSGQFIEAGMLGRNCAVGAAAPLDGATALLRAIVQVESADMAAETAVVKRLAKESETLRIALVRNDQSASAQTQQVAACNALHELEERLSRWLLQARDLLRSDTLPLTQEFLAQMLGVQRSSVTLVARRLQAGPKPLPRIRLRNRADRAALFWWTLDFSPQPSPGSRDPALRSPLRGGVPLNQVGIVAFLQASSRCEEPSQAAVQIDLPLRSAGTVPLVQTIAALRFLQAGRPNRFAPSSIFSAPNALLKQQKWRS